MKTSSIFVSSNIFFPQQNHLLTYLEKKCRLDCHYEPESDMSPTPNPPECQSNIGLSLLIIVKDSTEFWSGV